MAQTILDETIKTLYEKLKVIRTSIKRRRFPHRQGWKVVYFESNMLTVGMEPTTKEFFISTTYLPEAFPVSTAQMLLRGLRNGHGEYPTAIDPHTFYVLMEKHVMKSIEELETAAKQLED